MSESGALQSPRVTPRSPTKRNTKSNPETSTERDPVEKLPSGSRKGSVNSLYVIDETKAGTDEDDRTATRLSLRSVELRSVPGSPAGGADSRAESSQSIVTPRTESRTTRAGSETSRDDSITPRESRYRKLKVKQVNCAW
jgi:hypothetical protein